MKKRLLSVLLLLTLLLTLLPGGAFAASGSDDGSRFLTSHNPDSYVEFRLDGRKLTVKGIIEKEGLSSFFVRSERDGLYVIQDVTSGEPFQVELNLPPNQSGRTEITLYTRAGNDDFYWSYIFRTLFAEPDETDAYHFVPSPILAHNLSMRAAWVNPADVNSPEDVSDTVRALSNQIVGSETDPYQKLFLLNQWVAENVYYDNDFIADPTKPLTYLPDDVLESRRSVCEGYARLLHALVLAQGIPCFIVVTYSLGSSNFLDSSLSDITDTNHVHCEAFADGRWVQMDPTWGSRNTYENGVFTYTPSEPAYFDASDEYLAMTHKIMSRTAASADHTPSAWAQAEVLSAMANDLVPDALQLNYKSEISRSDFCDLLMNMLCKRKGAADSNALLALENIVPQENLFRDTTDPDILAANLLGIVNGTGDGLFTPERGITRQEAATMLMRASRYLGIAPNGDSISFPDFNSVAGWAQEGVSYTTTLVSLDGVSVMRGTDFGFAPLGIYTTEQSILTIYRLFRCK